MKIVYISGPYRSGSINGIHDNIEAARAEALRWWKRGHAVICPHCNTAYMDGAADDSVWLAGDIEILKRCDIIVMMKTWRRSEGAILELAEAKKAGLEIIYV